MASLTHARLRAAQGDAVGARAVLEALLRREPANAAARGLLERLAGTAGTAHAEPADEAAAAPLPARAAALGKAFRAALAVGREDRRRARLRRWAELVERNRGDRSDAR